MRCDILRRLPHIPDDSRHPLKTRVQRRTLVMRFVYADRMPRVCHVAEKYPLLAN
jgi:hypothetical protein